MNEIGQLATPQRAKRGSYSDVERGPGIYIVTNTINGKQYIGSANCMRDRFAVHRRALRLGSHHSQKFQRAWDKYGEAAFKFKAALSCSKENLLMYEQIFFDACQPHINGYNILKTAGSRAGMKHSDETRAKMSEKHKGKVISESQIAQMRARMQGYSPSAETRKKIGIAATSRKHSPDVVEKMRQRVVSPETRAKISAKLMGHSVSEESKAKRRESMKDYRVSDEVRQRISASMKKLRAEQRAKKAMADHE